MIKIILVDDHELFRLGIKSSLMNSGISIIGEAEDGKALFHLLQTTVPDLILLDILLPDMSGIDIAKRLHREYPGVRILVLSAENTEDTVRQLVDTGIDGFISKRQSNATQIKTAVTSIMEGVEFFGKDISAILYNIYVSKKKTTEPTSEFTERERDVIRLSGKGLLSKQIADSLHISTRTVDTHKNNIFRKLGINSTQEMILYAVRHGIINLTN